MPISKLLNIRRYTQTRIRCNKPFSCLFCGTRILAKDYEGHVTKNHGIDAKIQCVWCNGEKKWKFGQKEYQIDTHIMECFKKFMLEHCPPVRIAEAPVTEAPDTISLFPEINICEPLDLFGHSKFSDLHPLAYELFLILPDYPMQLTYQNPNLNLAASYVRYYEAEKDNMDFYHVMIRATAMNSAIRALGLYEDDPRSTPVMFLPFSCWCDGGKYSQPFLRQHRHMIAVAPKGTFIHSFWNRVSTYDAPNSHYKCKNYQRIESALHLINTIGYLCQRESKCNFTFKKGNAGDEYEEDEPQFVTITGERLVSTRSRRNHFYIFKALPKNFKMILGLQRDGGTLDFVDQKHKKLNPNKLMHIPIQSVDGKWRVKFRYIEGLPMDMILPVSKKFKPVPYVTHYFVYLTDHRKLYFDEDPRLEELDDDTWLQEQAQAGNLFFHVMGDTFWTPSPYHQKYINDVKPVWDLNEKLKKDLEELKRKHEEEIRFVCENYKRDLEEKDRVIEELKKNHGERFPAAFNVQIIQNSQVSVLNGGNT